MDMMFTRERIDKIVKELGYLRYSHKRNIDNIKFAPCHKDILKKPEELKPFDNGAVWGGYDKHFWFQINLTIPEEYEGRTVVFLISTGREGEWDAINPQFLAYINGKLVQGLDVNHRELFIADVAKSNQEFTIDLVAYSGLEDQKCFFSCSTAVLQRDIENLYYDLKVASEAANCLQEADIRRTDILKYLENAISLIDFRQADCYNESFLSSVREAQKYINKVLYDDYCGHNGVVVSGIGHTHIDVAWLWTLSRTREKAIRSFATVLELMRRYPEYSFMSSQPQLYEFSKESMPELYEEIKQRVKEGRWEPEGAMWLEADCNLISGESIIRQILFGKRFFKEEFKVDSRVLWLPDVFGYSAALPQILKKCGVDYFITSKISWNEYNKPPYDTFLWQGVDGSEILTYFITTPDSNQDYERNHRITYNGNVLADTVMGTWGRYQQKNLNNNVLMPYGFGDGGGGPTREMLEYGKRLNKGIPGIPRFEFDSLANFLKVLASKVEFNKDKLPRWVGELYLEYHRGTYTSMARNKKYNRMAENLLMEVEGLYTVVKTLLNGEYPSRKLKDCWKTLLLNQFHDILPGTSIRQVYEESQKQYENLLSTIEGLSDNAVKQIAKNIGTDSECLIAFNPTGFTMGNLIETLLPDWCKSVRTPEGEFLPIQHAYDGKSLVYIANVPSKGYASFELSAKEAQLKDNIIIRTDYMENSFYRVRLDGQGLITSIYDKINAREVIKKDRKANCLVAFEDMPHNYDAWDINIYYQQKKWALTDVESISVIENGPVRATLEIKRKFLNSTIVQKVHIYSHIPRIDFNTQIYWNERHILLKVEFPVDVHNDKATYDIQFGNIERPTHYNTPWDMARFEVCAHKWVDLSEDGYGVSLLNDCKYGHDIKDGNIRLTLLKSATYPNEDADREFHEFTYSLLPHSGDFRNITIKHAYALNMPFRVIIKNAQAGRFAKRLSFAEVDKENIVMETIKVSENGRGIIVRLYEAYNRRGKVKLKLPLNIKEAYECNMLEENIKPVTWQKNVIDFEVLPYEVKTFKVILDKSF